MEYLHQGKNKESWIMKSLFMYQFQYFKAMKWISIITSSITQQRCIVRCCWQRSLLLCLLLTLSITEVSSSTSEHVCQSIDIRNDVRNFQKLENCTVIEGYLHIVLIDHASWSDYQSLSFPKLVEITDYLMVFRAFALKSFSHIFPNLAVIRGQKVFVNYALVIFEVQDMEEIGLPRLTSITRGAVRLEKNSNLCYIHTINWSFISNVKDEDNFIMQNKDIDECVNACPKTCPSLNVASTHHTFHRKYLCWDYQNCQIVCPHECHQRGCYTKRISQGYLQECCHSECLGGCFGPEPTECVACQKVYYRGRCQQSCPPETYEYHHRRCISAEECIKPRDVDDETKWKLLNVNNKLLCEAECPDGFTEDKENSHRCVRCVGPCPKVCGGLTIDSVAAAQKLRGCTVIHGILEIQIGGGNQVANELLNSLGGIQEVTNYISVLKSTSLNSLSFFKNLRVIGGDNLYNKRYALFVLDNHNLQDIWDIKTHPNLTIGRGKVSFHFNRKLCLNKIEDLVRSLGLKNKTDDLDVSPSTNGDQVACNITDLKLDIATVKTTFAIIRWTNFHSGDHREILSWVVNYREAPQRNITIFDARDVCGTDVWKTEDVRPDVDKSAHYVAGILHQLKPYTQYAVYVHTYTVKSAARGARSAIEYFRTEPGQPSPARDINIKSRKTNELRISWKPPSEPNGNVTHYIIYWQPMPLDQEKFEWRNYCEDLLLNYNKSSTMQKTTKDKENEKRNSTKDPNCCACEKEKKESTPDEQERQNQINFENEVQDRVYRINTFSIEHQQEGVLKANLPSLQKGREESTGPSNTGMGSGMYKKRKRRDSKEGPVKYTPTKPPVRNIPPALTTDSSNLMYSVNNNLLNATHFTNGTSIEEDQILFDYDYAVVYGETELVLLNLHHFQEYSIEVIACHEYEEAIDEKQCSNRAIFSARTLPAEKADEIDTNNVTAKTICNPNGTSVRLHWDEPLDPNGLIVTYDIELQLMDQEHRKPDKFCISKKRYKEYKGYPPITLSKPGNWSYRIRATSLAGYGPYTPEKYFFIEDANDKEGFNFIWIVFIILVILTFMAVVFSVVCYVNKKHGVPSQSALYASINPDYLATSEVYVADEWEVDRDKIELLRELGQGSFGMVYEGLAKGFNGKAKQKVAVKTVNENASIKDRIEFLNEASVMKAFDCSHVVKLLGVVSKGQPSLVIMELMANGDLKTYLRMHRPDYEGNEGRKPPTLAKILQMAGEIADGMAYLSAKKFVHRDLAARNCMVSENFAVKIGDFGMTRDIYETDYYRKGGKGLLPVRWMAPESLRDGVFSSQSDVWSYGVVLWEMATLAAQPYQGLANDQVLKFVVDGQIMDRPEHCPDRLYDMMISCWKYQSRQRPSFNELIEELVPDLDESFRDVSFFFSDLNVQNESEVVNVEGNDNDDDGDDDVDDVAAVTTPLAGSPLHKVELNREDCSDDEVAAVSVYSGEADLDSSRSTLSYDSHLRHSPSSSPQNQNCYLVNNIEGYPNRPTATTTTPRGGTSDGSGEPCDSDSNVINYSKNRIKQPTTMSSLPKESRQCNGDNNSQQKWSPDTNSNPPSLPHSNEGSKGSSKSSGSGNGMNGISNGHIPRIIVPNPQC